MKETEYINDTSMSGLENSLTELVDSLEAIRRLNEAERRPAGRGIGIAAAAVILIGLAFSFTGSPRLKDTYDDPLLAYAEAEKALALISDAMSGGARKTAEAVEAFEAPREIIDNIIR